MVKEENNTASDEVVLVNHPPLLQQLLAKFSSVAAVAPSSTFWPSGAGALQWCPQGRHSLGGFSRQGLRGTKGNFVSQRLFISSLCK